VADVTVMTGVQMSDTWWSIEVLDGAGAPAARWKDAYSAALIEAALSHGARDWNWHEHRWGVVYEVAFADAADWDTYRHLPGVVAALDAVPDPVYGLLVYRGRGGSASSAQARRPGPRGGAGAAELPRVPEPVVVSQAGRERAATVPPSEWPPAILVPA